MKSVHSLMLGTAASILFAANALAADASTYSAPAYTTPAYTNSGGHGFEGFYAGVLMGGVFDNTSSYLTAPQTRAFDLGLAIGANFNVTGNVIAGAEIQANATFNTTASTVQLDALALAKVGFAPSDDFMVYVTGGGGYMGTKRVYAIGGGVEVAVMDSITARAEVLGIGTWGSRPDAVRATAGLLWHMQ